MIRKEVLQMEKIGFLGMGVMGLPMAMLRGMLIEMAGAMERSGVN